MQENSFPKVVYFNLFSPKLDPNIVGLFKNIQYKLINWLKCPNDVSQNYPMIEYIIHPINNVLLYHLITGYNRSPSSMSAMGGAGGGGGDPRGNGNGVNYGGGRLNRTPSTSAIYETLRRSKELRESLSSRPSSRLSLRGDSTVWF